MPAPPRFFVTGTDTGVGKTEVGAALLSLMADAGWAPAAFKPYESGCTRLSAPSDALALKAAARCKDPLSAISLHRFREPLAPGVAAQRARQRPSWRKTLTGFERFSARALVVEGAGGLLVPLDTEHDVLDLISALRLPVVLVARAGLGTLNHTGMSLLALHAAEVPVRAVVLSQGTRAADLSMEDNAELIAQRHGVEVLGPVPFTPSRPRRIQAFKAALQALVPPRRS